ncbi:MAG TPA: hypothetical protein VF556_12325 [Pyrinomonadaceae bacterium]
MNKAKPAKNYEEKYTFSLSEQRLYPFLKITREEYPKILVTRKIENDGAEYFGAFLPETRVRFLIDFLNKTFKLRSCDIEIDGGFDVPCTQFYNKRCVAPCVASLCEKSEYLKIVELVKLFLSRKSNELENHFKKEIERAAEIYEYEKAAESRDTWQSIRKIFSEKDWNLWLDDAVDTFEIAETEKQFFVYLVTQRGRKNLGKRVFEFTNTSDTERLLPDIFKQLYRFHTPREIRVSHDFAERKSLQENLSRQAGRKVKIKPVNENERKVSAERALNRTKYEYDFKKLKRGDNFSEIQTELKKTFQLKKMPRRIEAFDVAHISGEDYVAAKSVWENGVFLNKEYEYQFSGEKSELESLREFVENRFDENREKHPDLILIDGGQSHLQAALKGLERLKERNFSVVSAVKPPGRHGEISHFLTESGERVNFSGESGAHRLLQLLRDEAHALSNRIHRTKREMSHFYELAEILPSLNEKERQNLLRKLGSVKNLLLAQEKDLIGFFDIEKSKRVLTNISNYKKGNNRKVEPLIVPIRFDDENGDAKDLQPLSTYK